MRPVLAVGLVLGLISAAHASDEAKALIKRGIDAQGGPAALKARAVAEELRSKGTLYVVQQGAAAPTACATVSNHYSQEDGREGGTTRISGPGFTFEIIRVFDGKKAWQKINGEVKEEEAQDTARDVKNTYHERVGFLHGLLDDPAFGFKLLGESRVEGKPAVGVSVSRKGCADTILYFDKAAGLLVKYTFPFLNPGKDGKKTTHDVYLSAYQKVDFGAADERLLKEYEVQTTAKALLDLVRERTPTPAAAKKVKDLVRQLGDDKFAVREEASRSLIALGWIAVPALRVARKDADREVATRAARCLLRINPDREEKTVMAVVRLLGVRQPDGACKPLLALLPWANDALSREIATALNYLAMKEGKPDPDLVEALKDKDAARRTAAERALGRDGGKFARRAGRRVYPRGLQYAMKKTIYVDGKLFLEQEITEVVFFNRFDDAMFAKP